MIARIKPLACFLILCMAISSPLATACQSSGNSNATGLERHNTLRSNSLADQVVDEILLFVRQTLAAEANDIESSLEEHVSINLLYGDNDLLNSAQNDSSKDTRIGNVNSANDSNSKNQKDLTQNETPKIDLPAYRQNQLRRKIQLLSAKAKSVLKGRLAQSASKEKRAIATKAIGSLDRLEEAMNIGLKNRNQAEVATKSDATQRPMAVIDQMQQHLRAAKQELDNLADR